MLQNDLQVDKSIHKWHFAVLSSRISSSCISKCKYTTHAISTLNNIFFLDMQTRNYHPKYPSVLP